MKFTHIYIEENVASHPRTNEILQKFPEAITVEIENYKNIFNRPNQNFQAQKKLSRLILASKKEQFYYPGSALTDQFKIDNFYYNSMILNCVYNCDYCYLQGMYNSGHTVIFVNLEDFFVETDKLLQEKKSLYLCLSYDTDLLAFENLVPYCKEWLYFAKERKNLLIEIRTKSNLYSRIRDISPISNAILAWTVSPVSVIKKYEKKTPTLGRRIDNIVQAVRDGWKVRLCLDPILYTKNWEEDYSELLKTIFSYPEMQSIFDLSLGTFRVNSDYLKKMKRMRTDSDIIYYPFRKDGSVSMYPLEIQKKILKKMINQISKLIPEEKIFPSLDSSFEKADHNCGSVTDLKST